MYRGVCREVLYSSDSAIDSVRPSCDCFYVSTTELIEIIKALPKAERARVAEFIEQLDTDPKPKKQSNRDLTIINRRAARLNREAADVLDFQISL